MKHPPFCPNNNCDSYHYPQGRWYVKYGTYLSNRSGRVQRFKCIRCGEHFSEETFSINYHTHVTLPYKTIMEHLVTCSGIRDISRILKVSCSTVTNRIGRLARQAMAISAFLSMDLKLNEDLVADGFESFVKSQYLPNNINILAGKDSQFWFLSDYAQLTRKGRMTEYQKKKNKDIRNQVNINRVTIYESFQSLAQTALKLGLNSRKGYVNLYTDEHQQYRKVLEERFPFYEHMILNHIQISSRKARTTHNPLFSVNYLDREMRKDNSDHTRETAQFSRNVVNAMERLAVYRFYHNFIKPYRINSRNESCKTHGSVAGIPQVRIRKQLKTFFTQRRFLGKHGFMDISDRKLWCKCVFTPLKGAADKLSEYVLA